jgi:hypothetical protein
MNDLNKSEDSRLILSTETQLRKIVREELTKVSQSPPPSSLPRFVNTDEFRELVGCSRSYEGKIRKDGRIPFSREGKTIKYLLSDVEDFIVKSDKKGRSN